MVFSVDHNLQVVTRIECTAPAPKLKSSGRLRRLLSPLGVAVLLSRGAVVVRVVAVIMPAAFFLFPVVNCPLLLPIGCWLRTARKTIENSHHWLRKIDVKLYNYKRLRSGGVDND